MTAFPTSIDNPTNPTATSPLNSPSHSAKHVLENTAIVAIETKVGVDSSAVTTTLDYLLKSTSSIDPGHKHTTSSLTLALSNLTDVVISGLADAQLLTYEASSGKWKNKASSAPDASTTVKGLSKLDTAPVSPTSPIAVGTNSVLFTGTSGGTIDGSANKAVDQADVSSAAASGKIVRATGTALPALSGVNLTSIPRLISTVLPDVTLISSTTETALFTVSVPANTLGTASAVRFKSYLNAMILSSTKTLTLRLKYGSTTIATIVVTNSSGASSGAGTEGFIEGFLFASGATNTQNGHIMFSAGKGPTYVTSGTASSMITTNAAGTAAEDSTGALNLVVTAQFNNNSTDDTLVSLFTVVEKIA